MKYLFFVALDAGLGGFPLSRLALLLLTRDDDLEVVGALSSSSFGSNDNVSTITLAMCTLPNNVRRSTLRPCEGETSK